MIRVLLIDDHDLIRQGLRRSFERAADFEVVGEAGSVAEGLELAAAVQPDVVVMDVRLPDGNGLDATRRLRATSSSMGIVVLTMYAGDDQLLGALDAGASAFVPKNAPAADVLSAARHAVASPASFAAADLAGAIRRRSSSERVRLTERETQVLALLANGIGVAGIAKQLFISESTAKTHIAKIYDKLGAANRAQALMTALRMGLIDQDGENTQTGM